MTKIELTEQERHTISAALTWYRNCLMDATSAAQWAIVKDIAVGGDPQEPDCVAMTPEQISELDDRIGELAYVQRT